MLLTLLSNARVVKCTGVQRRESPVNRHEFDQLRKSKGKEITADIEFVQDKHLDEAIVVFDGAVLTNPFGLEIVVNGSYNRKTGHIKYNFVLLGTGPICRVEVNGAVHRDAGRTHKQHLDNDRDPDKNLPHAIPRPDLEGFGPKEVWEDLCKRACIDHTGSFVDPSRS
jgi:hypothetical protein